MYLNHQEGYRFFSDGENKMMLQAKAKGSTFVTLDGKPTTARFILKNGLMGKIQITNSYIGGKSFIVSNSGETYHG